MYPNLISFVVVRSFIPNFPSRNAMRHVLREDSYELEGKSSVCVSLADGRRLKMPKIEGCKLIGYMEGEGDKEIDCSDIGFLEIKELDKRKTMKLVAVGVTAGIVLIGPLSSGDWDEPGCLA